MPKPQSLKLKFLPLKLGQRSKLSLLIVLGSGILMGLAPAPLNAWFLAWVALAPLWVLVVRPKLEVRSLLLPLFWGIGYQSLALAWITGLHPLTWMGVPWLSSVAIALSIWVFVTLWGAMLVVIWAGLFRLVCRIAEPGIRTTAISVTHTPLPAWSRVLIGTALWCGLESLWSLSPLYWSSLSYTQSPFNLAILHLGQLSGSLMVTAAIVAVNGFLAEAWLSSQQSEARESLLSMPHILLRGAVILLITLHLIGFALYSRPLVPLPATALKVGIVQGNVPTRIKLSAAGVQRAIAGYTTGYEQLAEQGVDAVLTPEGALPFIWEDSTRSHSSLYQAILNRGVTIWLGAFVRQGNGITQSLLTITGNGETVGRYNKVKLVPLGEYVPFRAILGGVIDRLSPIEADMLPGAVDQHFDTPFGRAAAGICYESAYANLLRSQVAAGGQFILTASNLDPYSTTLMAQDQAQGVMRAIETDRWAVRATNTGYSSVVDPHGKVVWRSHPNVYELHTDTLYRRQTQTLYVRWGDWFTPLLLTLAAIAGGFNLMSQKPGSL